MADIRVTSVIETYQIPSRTFVPRRSIVQRWTPTVFLISCFCHSCSATPAFASIFEGCGAIRSSTVCCKCGSQISWCAYTNLKDGYRWRCRRITSASTCSASTSIKHVSWFQQWISRRVCSSRTTWCWYEHDREHAAYEGTPQSLQPVGGLHLSPGPLHVCGGVPIPQSGPVHQIHQHRCNLRLERHSSPPSRSWRYINYRRPTPYFSSCYPQYVSLWRAHHHEWRGAVMHGTILATHR